MGRSGRAKSRAATTRTAKDRRARHVSCTPLIGCRPRIASAWPRASRGSASAMRRCGSPTSASSSTSLDSAQSARLQRLRRDPLRVAGRAGGAGCSPRPGIDEGDEAADEDARENNADEELPLYVCNGRGPSRRGRPCPSSLRSALRTRPMRQRGGARTDVEKGDTTDDEKEQLLDAPPSITDASAAPLTLVVSLSLSQPPAVVPGQPRPRCPRGRRCRLSSWPRSGRACRRTRSSWPRRSARRRRRGWCARRRSASTRRRAAMRSTRCCQRPCGRARAAPTSMTRGRRSVRCATRRTASPAPRFALAPADEPTVYFELTVLALGERAAIGIGLSVAGYRRNAMPGWDSGSFGWHGDDGKTYRGDRQPGREFSAPWAVGDVVGMGLLPRRREIFLTLNGRQAGQPLRRRAAAGLLPVHRDAQQGRVGGAQHGPAAVRVPPTAAVVRARDPT